MSFKQVHMATFTAVNATPVVHGVKLVSPSSLADRIKPIFRYPLFNAIQSRSFETAYKTDDNLVLVAPTASGKTTVLELAICRLFVHRTNHTFKVVYVAPTKSLCSERQRDWATRFTHLGLQCVELTGDTEQQDQLLAIRNADIIITTPEKWDSITRKWKDHKKLVEQIKLFLIDEVHLLKEDRGATLEAIVSRMKSVGTSMRVIALSATVPNPEDIATWLGRGANESDRPAALEVFDDSYRPVKLEKHVYGYNSKASNDFAFEKMLDNLLPALIVKHGQRKPILIFCSTRKSATRTASLLCNWWSGGQKSWVNGPTLSNIDDQELKAYFPCGVAFHHGGLNVNDRRQVESSFLSGDISVICCTSTLAVGLNLPCHLVVIKNTTYWNHSAQSQTEYSELEVIQMLGRAGRPQFDRTAVAVIMTRQEKSTHYEKLVSGKQPLESRLHLNLIEHFNAEIGLGTIHDLKTAKEWLARTFFAVRLRKNASYYRVSSDLNSTCEQNIDLLKENALISESDDTLKSTQLGDAMASYCIKFETMKLFLQLPAKPRISEILSALAQATEFNTIRFRSGEKQLYKAINECPLTKYPIKVNLALVAHKVSLIMQASLGGVELKNQEQYRGQRMRYVSDETLVYTHVHRLLKAIVECQLSFEDSTGVRNALCLSRSISSRCWEDSPLQMAQLEGIGPVAVRKFVDAGIKSLNDLSFAECQKIDMILSRNPPFGAELLRKLARYPKLRVTLKMSSGFQPARNKPGVAVTIRAEVGFMNDNPQAMFQQRPVYICFLAETSDDRVVHFCRLSGQKLEKYGEIRFVARFVRPHQFLTCYVSCESLVSTTEHASLDPKLDSDMFARYATVQNTAIDRPGTSGLRNESAANDCNPAAKPAQVSKTIGDIAVPKLTPQKKQNEISSNGSEAGHATEGSIVAGSKQQKHANLIASKPAMVGPTIAVRLPNGKWECSHKCKNKALCRHYCCNEGMDKPPAPPRKKKQEPQLVSEANSLSKIWGGHQSNVAPEQGLSSQDRLQFKRNSPPLPSDSSFKNIEDDEHFEDIEGAIQAGENDYTEVSDKPPFKRRKMEASSSMFLSTSSSPNRNPIIELDQNGSLKVLVNDSSIASVGPSTWTEPTGTGTDSFTPDIESMQSLVGSTAPDGAAPNDFEDEVLENHLTVLEEGDLLMATQADEPYDSSAEDLGLVFPRRMRDLDEADVQLDEPLKAIPQVHSMDPNNDYSYDTNIDCRSPQTINPWVLEYLGDDFEHV